uniref:4-aminobutyrate aminotransferase n=3 Tax=Choreotrichia TaxID=141411 RepID=A0A7S3HWH8_9SPIT|mmetsp:Transcript_14941/g.18807  ORF Transcript_14941/g.18807 Transcript_14941/m.18807 type:complete len:412 (+) Transcript_14941:278-1513(+)|eukprot:CAMPEP_0170468748 /NCGR_PEP_ID=MMETSP0123-20130129/11810_1 /TAXON_ID=182087 /ORGANISM="Favella ehrenbergii, Strain Fehren 1" /LENGTH=411 /DNA_ID=CAMNT_0010735391 /DNA_START=259 /DNA_END=1494 /DNA_ORIENTATION=+
MLDVFCSIGTNGVGYNHPKMLEVAESERMQRAIATRTGLGINPSTDQHKINQEAFMSVAPPNMDRVTAAMCGSCAVEGAVKVAMMAYRVRQDGGVFVEPTPEELCSCLDNQAPGSPNLSVLSLKQGFHGRLCTSLSLSRSKALHKVDVPAFDWPASQNPLYKYPLSENVEYNREQDRVALADMRAKIEQWRVEKGSEVCAVIMEPIQSEGGENLHSPEFAQGVRELTKELGIFFIVDEVQTGVCSTGTFWAHEQWNLSSPPDFVTFAKRMLSCGFYHNHETKSEQPYRHFNTFFGDSMRALLTAQQNKIIKEDNLAAMAAEVGDYLQDGLREMELKYPKLVRDPRGLGTYRSFTVDSAPLRDALGLKLKSYGVNQGPCGDHSLRLRPTLYFEKSHADFYLDALDKACKDLA